MWRTCEQASRLCKVHLCAGSFFVFFPFSRLGLRFFVLSALNIGEYKCFDGNIYRNLRKLSLLFCFVNKHDFELTWLWDVNPLEQPCFDCICWFIVPVTTDSSVFIRSNIVWNWWKKINKSVPEPRNGKLCKYWLLYSSGEILESAAQSLFTLTKILKLVARSLFTLTINEDTIANICLYLCFQLIIIYIEFTFSN